MGVVSACDCGVSTAPSPISWSTVGELHRSMEVDGSWILSSSKSDSPTKLTSSHSCSQPVSSTALSALGSQDTVADRFSTATEVGTQALSVEAFPSNFPSPSSSFSSSTPKKDSLGETRTVSWAEGDRDSLLLTAGGTLKMLVAGVARSTVDDAKG